MNIIIAGGGMVGATLSSLLCAEGHSVTLVDQDQLVLDKSMESYDVMGLCGNCASMETLYQAGVMDADLIIAVTNSDEINLLCCTVAHGLNKNIHAIGRIRTPEYTEQAHKLRDIFGLKMVINPDRHAAMEIERLLQYPGFLKLDSFTKGFVLVNGFNVGRYYTPAGPQKTLYIPAPLLKQGENEIIVFESDSFHSPTVEFVDTPELG